jgi:hypothetical protein
MTPAPDRGSDDAQSAVAPGPLAAILAGTRADALPLRAAAAEGGRIEPESVRLTLLSQQRDGAALEAVVGMLFTEIVGGCSCGDEPYASSGWCRLRLQVDADGTACWTLLPD